MLTDKERRDNLHAHIDMKADAALVCVKKLAFHKLLEINAFAEKQIREHFLFINRVQTTTSAK